MKRKRKRPTVSGSLILDLENTGVVALPASQSVLTGQPVACEPAKISDQAQVIIEHVVPSQPAPQQPLLQQSLLLFTSQNPMHARPQPLVPDKTPPQYRRNRLLPDGVLAHPLLLPTSKGDHFDWQPLHRFVSLSFLGWAFVLTAVFWELFAVAFSQSTGWGWNKGLYFFIWGLGVLAFGFYLRTSRKRTSISPLFLGMNILVVSVLSLIVATR